MGGRTPSLSSLMDVGDIESVEEEDVNRKSMLDGDMEDPKWKTHPVDV